MRAKRWGFFGALVVAAACGSPSVTELSYPSAPTSSSSGFSSSSAGSVGDDDPLPDFPIDDSPYPAPSTCLEPCEGTCVSGNWNVL